MAPPSTRFVLLVACSLAATLASPAYGASYSSAVHDRARITAESPIAGIPNQLTNAAATTDELAPAAT